MSGIVDRVRHEPALVTAFVGAVIALAVAFGVNLSSEQIGAVMAVVVAALGFVTRSQVTPASEVVARIAPADVGTDVDVVAGPAHPAETGTPVEIPPAA